MKKLIVLLACMVSAVQAADLERAHLTCHCGGNSIDVPVRGILLAEYDGRNLELIEKGDTHAAFPFEMWILTIPHQKLPDGSYLYEKEAAIVEIKSLVNKVLPCGDSWRLIETFSAPALALIKCDTSAPQGYVRALPIATVVKQLRRTHEKAWRLRDRLYDLIGDFAVRWNGEEVE